MNSHLEKDLTPRPQLPENGEEPLQKLEQRLAAEVEKNKALERALKTTEERFRTLEESLLTRLKQAQKMEAIGTLASGIAHDFNNILAVISGNCELAMISSPAESPVHPFLAAISTAGDRAKDLVQQILNFAKRTEKPHKPTLIYVVLNEALKLLRASIPSTVEFKLNLCRDMLYVMGDVVQIYQILIKLCTDAAQAMEVQGGVLTVALIQRFVDLEEAAHFSNLKAGPHLHLTISDTGKGIDAEQLANMFDSNFSSDDLSATLELGLPEIKKTIQGYQGEFTVDSKAGQGTTYSILLPILESVSEGVATEQSPLPTGSERILFVDDEPFLAQVGEKYFTSLGYQVSSFDDSLKAWESFQRTPDHYDLVITDMTMPHITGNKLAQQITRLRPDIPVILCSGFKSHLLNEAAKPTGVTMVVAKPVALSKLALNVRRLLDTPIERPSSH